MTLFKKLIACSVLASIFSSGYAEEVNVYSARNEALIKPILDVFSQQTGIKVNLVTGKADALISRLASEANLSPADVLITTDVGRLERAKGLQLLQAFDSKTLQQAIPAHLRDSDNQWFGLTLRARPIMYVQGRVDPASLSTLDALADEKWQGRVCIRSSDNIYTQSMLAALMAQEGAEKVQQWLKGFVESFARPPKGGDRDQIKAAVAGICDVAIANTYYLAGMLTDTDESNRNIASQVKVFWPNQEDRGTHVNISGAAITQHAPNKTNAEKLLSFMVTQQAQAWYAQTNHEYPVVEGVEWSPILKDFGTFKAEQVPLEKVGELNKQAVEMMDRAGWK